MKKFYTGALFSLLLSSVGMTGACAVEDADDGADRGNPAGGKADEITQEDCDNASLDDNQVCRQDNGQFAPAACCADELACLNNASISDDGKCRDSDNGQFLPAACCDALCEGAAIVNGFCRNEQSGQFMLSACCADICFDLQPAFDPEDGGDPFVEGACGECGEESPDGCFCDDICAEEGDCCEDFVDACPDIAEASGLGDGADGSDPAFSCENSCGEEAAGGGCFCDEVCAEFGDCCGDKVAHCGGEGSDAVIACEVDECAGAAVDDNFICRKPNGQFANPACCGLDRCDDADLQENDDGSFACRDTESGQFVPMVCCDDRCRDTSLDRSGICRKGDGTFADPSCCADDCFRAQERGNGTGDIDACNGGQPGN
jgi:hypothetical protein